MVAGGVGLAPFVTLAEALQARGTTTRLFYGARRAAELHYVELFERLGVEPVLATEDGSRAHAGLRDRARSTRPWPPCPARGDVRLYACGPTPMMRAVAALAASRGTPCDVSLEQVMGCGLGGCYSCVVLARDADRRAALHPILHRGPGLRRGPHRLERACATDMDLSVSIGSLTLANPLIAASGCFGYGVEYSDVVDLSSLGGVAVKGLFLAEREGHPPPRIVETPSGMLNAIGLQGIGVHRFVREKLPELRDRRAVVVVNICGTTIDEYCEISRDPVGPRGGRAPSSSTSRAPTSRKAASRSGAASPARTTSSAPSAR